MTAISPFCTLQGRQPVTEQVDLVNIGRRLDFSSPTSSYSKAKTFTASSGFTVTSTTNVYNTYPIYSCHSAPNSGSTYLLQYLFDQTLHTSVDQFFLAADSTTTLTLDLKGDFHVNRLKIFPNALYPTKFKVKDSFSVVWEFSKWIGCMQYLIDK